MVSRTHNCLSIAIKKNFVNIFPLEIIIGQNDLKSQKNIAQNRLPFTCGTKCFFVIGSDPSSAALFIICIHNIKPVQHSKFAISYNFMQVFKQ